MGEISRALGVGSQLDYQGKTYTLSPWTLHIQGRYERYLEAEAVKSVRAMPLSDTERKDLLQSVQRDITAGLYSFGSELVAESLRSLRHLKYLLFLMLLPGHPDVTVDVIEGMVTEKMNEVMEAMSAANADPTKAVAPTTPPTPPPSTPTP